MTLHVINSSDFGSDITQTVKDLKECTRLVKALLSYMSTYNVNRRSRLTNHITRQKATKITKLAISAYSLIRDIHTHHNHIENENRDTCLFTMRTLADVVTKANTIRETIRNKKPLQTSLFTEINSQIHLAKSQIAHLILESRKEPALFEHAA
jgi:hypothetical protein